MDKNEQEIFFGPLPVSKPCPILKPSEKIQLQPTVSPVAITPFIALEDDGVKTAPEALAEEKKKVADKSSGRASARVGGSVMLVFTLLSVLVFVFSAVKIYPIAAAEQYLSIGYFYELIEFMFQFKQFTQFDLVFAPYLVLIGYIAVAVNFILAVIAIAFGKRMNFSICAIITFLTFVVAAFYEMKLFSGIKAMGNLLSRPEGWDCLMLIIMAVVNLLVAWVAAMICPKHRVIETVEF